MDKYLKSAIIGYWRCGASFEWICVTTGFNYFEINNIIENHKTKTNEPSKKQQS